MQDQTQPVSPQTSHENAHTRWLTNLSWSALRKRGRIMWRKLLVRSSLGWLLALLIEPFNLLLRKLWSVAEEESDDEGRQMEWEREEEVCGAKLQRQRSGCRESEKMRDWAVMRGRCGWIGQESMVWMRMISVMSAWFITDVFMWRQNQIERQTQMKDTMHDGESTRYIYYQRGINLLQKIAML